MTPDVAVIIPAWNASQTLARAVNSALHQTGVTLEVVVVDDASSDDTLTQAKEMAKSDGRLRVLRQSPNQGPAAARNLALKSTEAKYVTPLDSDDFMEDGRLLKLFQIAEEGGWDFVADDLFKVPEADVEGVRERLISDGEIGLQTLDFETFVEGNLARHRAGRRELGFIKPLISTTFLQNQELHYNETLRLGEDYILYATALQRGARFCLTDPAGYVSVTRPTSLSGQHSARDLGALVHGDRILMAEANLSSKEHVVLQAHHLEVLKKWHWLRLIDAVKARNLLEIARSFKAPPRVIGSLMSNLIEQFTWRSSAKLKATFIKLSEAQSRSGKGGQT